RLLREGRGGEEDERGGESELSHARLDRASTPRLASCFAGESRRKNRSPRFQAWENTIGEYL
ncbi:MAG TPA: hypothetical protein VII75_03250, partial [Thermoanaerobaculia bacterium]